MGTISSYSTLQTELLNMLDRDDITANLSLLIQMGEQRIYREVRCRGMEATLNVTISSGVAALPSDYIDLKDAHILDSNKAYPLERRLAADIYQRFPQRTSTRRPEFIAREVDNFIFGAYPDANYTVRGTYYKRLAALSTTNWFTDNAPDILFWASLAEAEPFIGNDERILLWESKYERARDRITDEYKGERRSGGPVRVIAG